MNDSTLIKSIKAQLLDEKCPLIDVNEDDNQIKSLLLNESEYRNELIRWFLENFTDTLDYGGVNEALSSLGLSLKTLKSWKMALNLHKSKKVYSESGIDGLRQTRQYMDFLTTNNLVTPTGHTSSAKSNLIPRDIDKDVTARAKKDEDLDILAMTEEELEEIQKALGSALEDKKAAIGNHDAGLSDKSVLDKMTTVVSSLDKYRHDYEQDFKPWTSRMESPLTDERMEISIQNLHTAVSAISENLTLNANVRQSSVGISETVKEF